jgi:DNA-binding transcriptional LysR family regulator
MNEAWAFAPLTSISGRSMEHAFRVNGLGLPRIMVVASSMQLLRSLVMENEFLALFPSSVVRSAQDVRVLPVNVGARWQPIGILTVKHRMLSPLAKLFMECAHQVMQGIE